MKNFKKVLALVLAVATVFSFAAMATAAEVTYDDLTDTASITHVEAVKVLTGVGVINGFEDKTFKPAESVTRVQMAKMVGFIMNDGDDINDLYKAACPFADSKSNWGAGYIAYCATQGIVNGRDANTFDPNATVTGAEAAKMLLCAMGYDATIEGFVGSDWSVNVLNVAKKAGLLDELSQSKMGVALNREDAAQMIFNALQAQEVKYPNKGTTVTINGATIATGAQAAEPFKTTNQHFDGQKTEQYQLWGETHFIDSGDTAKQLKLVKPVDGKTDDFGVAATVWQYGKDKDNQPVEIAKDLKLAKTYSGVFTAQDLYTLTGKIGTIGNKANEDTITVYIDGANKATTYTTWVDGTVVNENNATQRAKAKIEADEIEVYITDKKADEGVSGGRMIQIIGKNYRIGYVSAYHAAGTKVGDDAYITVTKEAGPNGAGRFDTTAFSAADKENETKVVYTYANGKIQSLKKVDAVASGKVTKIDTDKDGNQVFTADGKTYTGSKNFDKAIIALNGEYDLFLDPNGKVLFAEETKSGSSNYYMVMKAGEVKGSGIDAAETVYQVRLLGTDGKTIDLNVAKLDDAKVENLATLKALTATAADEDLEIKDANVGAIVTYKLNSKGEAELTKVTATTTDAKTGSKGTKADGTINGVNYEDLTNIANMVTSDKKANSSTAFVLISLDKAGNYVYTPVSGIGALKAVFGNYDYYKNVTVNVKSESGKTAEIDVAGAAFIFVGERNVTSAKTVFTTLGISDHKEAHIAGKTDRDVSFREVFAIENGEVKTLKVEESALKGNLWTDTNDNKKIDDGELLADRFFLASSYTVDDDGYVTKIAKADAGLVAKKVATIVTKEVNTTPKAWTDTDEDGHTAGVYDEGEVVTEWNTVEVFDHYIQPKLSYAGGTLTLGEEELTQDNVNIFLYDAEAEGFKDVQKVAKNMTDDVYGDLWYYKNTTSNTTKSVVAIFGQAAAEE